MHPLVRNLWRRVIVASKLYPGGEDVVKRKGREYMIANADITCEREIRRAVYRGRWYIKNEVYGVIYLKKFREMARRYDS